MIPNEINYIYGLPAYITKLDPKLYEKNKILSQIEKNYKLSKARNKWAGDSFFKTEVHYLPEDKKNPKLKKINYYSLPQQYEKIITNFLHKLAPQKNFTSTNVIVNCTCIRHNSVMLPHIHTGCTFSLVHYLSFDKKQHLPTIFKSPYYFNQLLPQQENLRSIFTNQEENSWIYKEWIIDTEEDDLIIVPAILEHGVRNLDSKKSRITIAVNISINDEKSKEKSYS
jgi:hypothetical protein